MKNNNNYQNNQTKAVRILALVLALLMVGGAVSLVISLLA